jgi:hypothetical protein
MSARLSPKENIFATKRQRESEGSEILVKWKILNVMARRLESSKYNNIHHNRRREGVQQVHTEKRGKLFTDLDADTKVSEKEDSEFLLGDRLFQGASRCQATDRPKAPSHFRPRGHATWLVVVSADY